MSNSQSVGIDWKAIIDKYYPGESKLRDILIKHSRAVAGRALRIAEAHPELPLDRVFLFEAAMLHDIGIVCCDAPGIECHGTEPYIRHGMIGAEMLRAEGLPRHARVCERHTGAGLTQDEIRRQHLPLPERDFLPETLEEKVICYADKFYSKTHVEREKSMEKAMKSMSKFDNESLERFLSMAEMFEPELLNGQV